MSRALSLLTLVALALFPAGAARATELDLAQAYQLALKNNPDIQIATETLIRAELTRRRSFSLLKPTVTLSGNYTRNSAQAIFNPTQLVTPVIQPSALLPNPPDLNIIIQRYDALFGAIRIHQPIVNIPGIVSVVTEGVRRDVTKLEVERSRQQVLLAVARAYYDAVAARESVKVAEHTRQNREEQAKKQRILLANGAAVETSVLQAELDVAESDRQIVEAKASWDLATERLRILCHLPDSVTVGAPGAVQLPPLDEPGLVEQALQLRPDMRSANRVVESQNLVRWEPRARFLPEIALDWNGNASNAASFTGANFVWSLVLSASWVIYDGGARYVDVKLRESDIRESLIRQRKVRDQVTTEVRGALIEVRRLSERWKQAQREAELARRNEVAVKARFDNGAATPLEQSDAGTRRLASEINEVSTRYALQASLVSLDVAMGKDVSR